MALRFQTPPDRALRSTTAALDALRTAPVPGFPIEAALAAPALRYPHVVYNMRLDDLAAGKGLETAAPTGWAHITGAPGTVGLLAEVKYDTQEFSQLNQGPFASGIADSIATVESEPTVQAGDYELNVLRIPGIYVIALWLKDAQGISDAIVPVPPVPPEFEAGRFYTAAQFTEIARGMAQRRLAFDNSPRG